MQTTTTMMAKRAKQPLLPAQQTQSTADDNDNNDDFGVDLRGFVDDDDLRNFGVADILSVLDRVTQSLLRGCVRTFSSETATFIANAVALFFVDLSEESLYLFPHFVCAPTLLAMLSTR